MRQNDPDIVTRQVEWIKKRELGGNDQLIKMIRYIERLEDELKLKHEQEEAP